MIMFYDIPEIEFEKRIRIIFFVRLIINYKHKKVICEEN